MTTPLSRVAAGFRLIAGETLNTIIDRLNGIVAGTTSMTALTTAGTVDLQGAVFALDSFTDTLTAHAGGGQGSALALTKAVNVGHHGRLAPTTP
jgi:hypothetical protein